jgi:two-component system, NtrC family, response regulator AtoC
VGKQGIFEVTSIGHLPWPSEACADARTWLPIYEDFFMDQFKVFIVEDDPWYGEVLKYHLSLNPDYEVHLFKTARECLDNLNKKPNVICIDFGLPDMKGDVLLKRINQFNRTIPVIVISGQEEIAVALGLLRMGAYEYIIKDDHATELLWNAIVRIRENASLKEEVAELKEQLEQKFSFEKTIIGQSPAIRKTFSVIEKAARSNINVSISGETGTGKEVVARAIHFNSDRGKKPFVTVNMAAIPRELIESELFGHEKGAFTGAVARRIGKFEEAAGGTLFLDEIGELEMSMQAKLLRVIQEREVTRVGGNELIKFDVRLITATHQDLSALVKTNEFREDLFYRIIGLPIELPALRERGEDVLILAKHFIQEYAKSNKMAAPVLSTPAREKLMKYNFPGNVRELKALVELACVMSDGKEIQEEDITFTTLKTTNEFTAIEKTLADYTWDIIRFYLNKYNNNVVLVANKLQIGKSTIYNLLKRYGNPE